MSPTLSSHHNFLFDKRSDQATWNNCPSVFRSPYFSLETYEHLLICKRSVSACNILLHPLPPLPAGELFYNVHVDSPSLWSLCDTSWFHDAIAWQLQGLPDTHCLEAVLSWNICFDTAPSACKSSPTLHGSCITACLLGAATRLLRALCPSGRVRASCLSQASLTGVKCKAMCVCGVGCWAVRY